MFAVNRIASPLSVLVFLGLAASSPLTCNVTKQPNGSFRYRVSQPHGPGCMTSWEDSNGTVIAHSLDRVRTNQSVTLDVCLDFLHYTRDCVEGWEETYCRVNCTLHLDQGLHLLTVNSTRICFSLKMCTNQSNIWRILAPFVLLILLIVFILLAVWKCKCRTAAHGTVSYTAAPCQVKTVK